MRGMYRWLYAVGCLLGAGGVGAGALGAHFFRLRLSVEDYASYLTGVDYLLVHAVALVAVSVSPVTLRASKLFSCAAIGMVIGVVLFAGGLLGWTSQGWAWARHCAPWGGTLLILAWVGLAISALCATPREM